MAWTQEKTELAKTLWLEGHSAPNIAQQLGRGFTRNAVVGKMHRLGLVRKRSDGQVKPIPSKKPAGGGKLYFANPRNRLLPPERVHDTSHVNVPKSRKLTLMQRRDCDCHFLTGPGEYCGHPVREGTVYCEAHCQIVYVPKRSA